MPFGCCQDEMPYERLNLAVSSVSAILNEGTDEQCTCVGYRSSLCKKIFFYLWAVLTLGLPFLLTYWRPEWGVWWKFSKCDLARADVVLIKDANKQYFKGEVTKQPVSKFPAEFAAIVLSATNENNGNLSSRAQLMANQVDSNGCYLRMFTHQHSRYVWNSQLMFFQRLRGYENNTLCADFYEKFKGFSEDQRLERSIVFGENAIYIEMKSYGKLLVTEVLNPFYIFQIFSIILWSTDDYYYFASCIFLLSVISISVSLYKTRKQSEILNSMASSSVAYSVTVVERDSVVEMPATNLVPGDVLAIPPNGCTMTCDAVLVAGNCIVNESMLTGESVPVTKTPLLFEEGEMYSSDMHKRHTLFSGTKVLQTRYYGTSHVTAVVVRTGFSTAKGELIKSILFPKPIGFQFYKDAMKFIGILACIASLGMVYSAILFLKERASITFIIKRALDIVTIVVPPALPAAMTVGSVYAQNRLRARNIFCISPPRINVCGKIKLFCFDKTGTLTEDGLDFWGIVEVSNGSFQVARFDPSTLHQRSQFLAGMASCHSLTMIDSELTGDPLDIKMFEATKWDLEESGSETTNYDRLAPTVARPPPRPTTSVSASSSQSSAAPAEMVLIETNPDQQRFDVLSPTVVKPVTKDTYVEPSYGFLEGGIAETELKVPYEIGIVRQFPFSSTLQMMSVIVRVLGQTHMELYAKGAPEKIASLCDPASVPENFNDLLHEYTVQGFRVIALGWRALDEKLSWHQVQRMKRDVVEKDLKFLGMIILQNTLKPETAPVIRTLKAAAIRTVMVTGDNIYTAISVARDCGMVPPTDDIVTLKATTANGSTPAALSWSLVKGAATPLTDIPSGVDHYEDIGQGIVGIPINHSTVKHFATDGKSFAIVRQHFPDVLVRLAIRGTIFARMAPDQKAQLVELLQDYGYIVGMCGDGANDCGALKAAHVGISLSDTEASVAAPFTSKVQNIECVVTVMREGRCALVTSFGVFKYMALYSIIQFVSVLILYTYRTNLDDSQFLYIDLAITTSMAVFMGYTEAYHSLVPERPNGRLIAPVVMVSIFSQIFLAAAIQISAFVFLVHQPWYKVVHPDKDRKFTPCLESTIIFCVSNFQYMIVAAAFSKGKPFRKPIYANLPLTLSIIILTTFSAVLLIYPGPALSSFFKLVDASGWEGIKFGLFVMLFPLANLVLSVVIECLVSSRSFKRLTQIVTCKRKPKNLYKELELAFQNDNSWPPIR